MSTIFAEPTETHASGLDVGLIEVGVYHASVSASADGRRLVGTAARSMSSLWRVPLGDREARTADAVQIDLPTPRGSSPRIAPGFIVYRAPKAGLVT